MSDLVAVDRLNRVFDVSEPWLNRLLEGKQRLLLKAVSDVSFSIAEKTVYALVGESGSGKSTIGKIVVGLLAPSSGSVKIEGVDLAREPDRAAVERIRSDIQMIFQDPYASLNPRWRVGDIIAEPKLIVCDEPTSALDVSVQAQVLNLMSDLQENLGLTYLLISHDLTVVRHMADRIGVLYLGRLVEEADTDVLFRKPLHPYTQMLFEAAPRLDGFGREVEPPKGEIPDPINPPPGCAFHPRCPLAVERCSVERPEMRQVGKTRVACHVA